VSSTHLRAPVKFPVRNDLPRYALVLSSGAVSRSGDDASRDDPLLDPQPRAAGDDVSLWFLLPGHQQALWFLEPASAAMAVGILLFVINVCVNVKTREPSVSLRRRVAAAGAHCAAGNEP
jgi:hypothetical protein